MAGTLREVTRPRAILRQEVSKPHSMVKGNDGIILTMHDEDGASDRSHRTVVAEKVATRIDAGRFAATFW